MAHATDGASSTARTVLDGFGVHARSVRVVPGAGPLGTTNSHVWPADGGRVVLRRYHLGASLDELSYEHAVLSHLARQGWTVPDVLAGSFEHDGRLFSLTRYVPGRARSRETASQRYQRGRDLAQLQGALAELRPSLGQRPGWRAQHEGITVHADVDWEAGIAALAEAEPVLAARAQRAAVAVAEECRQPC